MKVLLYVFSVLLIAATFSLSWEEQQIDFVKCLPPNGTLCNRVKCAPLKDCRHGIIEPNGSRCRCCPVCVTFLDENKPCTMETPPVDGPVHSTRCKPGFKCDNGICTGDPSLEPPCTLRRRERQNATQYFTINPVYNTSMFEPRQDFWYPECDSEGYFLQKQCQHSRCYCVDRLTGNRIFGQEEVELSVNMTCECSATLHRRLEVLRKLGREAEWNTYEQEHCTGSGDYESLQCFKDTCFCVDSQTGIPNGTMVKIKQRDLLYCYEEKLHKESYLQRCEKQLITERRILYDFFQKGVTIIGLIDIDCDPDGKFVKSLCQPEICYCSDREGVSFGTYKKDKQDGALDNKMKCYCARDEQDILFNHARYPRLKCDSFGNFASFQCDGNKCFCVDTYGDRVTEIFGVNGDIKMKEGCNYIRALLGEAV